MIPRRFARRLLDEYLARLEKAEAEGPEEFLDADGVRAVAIELLDESDLVIRGTENATQKAVRMLGEGRLRVEKIADGLILASCRGDEGEEYALGYRPDEKRWGCTCEANATFNRRCSHLRALQLVCVRPKAEGERP